MTKKQRGNTSHNKNLTSGRVKGRVKEWRAIKQSFAPSFKGCNSEEVQLSLGLESASKPLGRPIWCSLSFYTAPQVCTRQLFHRKKKIWFFLTWKSLRKFQLQNFWHSEESHHLSLPPSFPLNYEDNRYNPFHLLHYKFGMPHCIMKTKDYISKCQWKPQW